MKISTRKWLLVAFVVEALGCGSSSASVRGDASQSGSAIQRLKGIEQEIDARTNAILIPFDEVDALVNDLKAFKERSGLTEEQFALAFQANGSAVGTAQIQGGAAQQAVPPPDLAAEIAPLRERLGKVASGVVGAPEQAKQLLIAIAEAIPTIPALAAEATASLQVTANNPFADAGAKAQAQTDLAEVQQAPQRIADALKAAQAKLSVVPERLAAATAQLATVLPGTALTSVASTVSSTASPDAIASVTKPPASSAAPPPPPAPQHQAQTDNRSRGSSGGAWYVASGVLAATALTGGLYTVERNSAAADCQIRAPGYGCTNTDTIMGQRTGGMVAAGALGVLAVTALVIAIIRDGAEDDGAESASIRCGAGAARSACVLKF